MPRDAARCREMPRWNRLLHLEQLDVEDQRGVGRDDAGGAPRAVAHGRRDDQAPLPADAHADHTAIPPLNHLPSAQAKLEWLAAVARGVELCAIGEPARIMHRHALSGPRLWAISHERVYVLHAVRQRVRLPLQRRRTDRLSRHRSRSLLNFGSPPPGRPHTCIHLEVYAPMTTSPPTEGKAACPACSA